MIAAVDLLANDTDPDGDTLVISAVSALSSLGATVILNGDGSVTYDPTTSTALDEQAQGETLEDSFTYAVSDGNGGFDTATVTLTVSGVGDTPILTGTTSAQSGFTDQAFSYQFAADLFTDHDKGEAITNAVTLADGGPLTSCINCNASTRTLSYAANAPQIGDIGLYALMITASEPDGQSSTATFTLSVPDGGDDRDFLYGAAGDDVLLGGNGDDYLYGEDGDDNLFGQAGNDLMRQGNGDDLMSGGAGADTFESAWAKGG